MSIMCNEKMKVLILSCNTGGGHNSAAKAIAEEVKRQGDQAVVLDYLSLAGGATSKIVANLYIELVKRLPSLFGVVYNIGMLVSRLVRKSPVYYANGKMAKYLNEYIKDNPVDVIVMPHLYPAETITKMKREGMHVPLTVAVGTDYTCIPFWEETDCDYYVVPNDKCREEFAKRGISKEKIVAYGIPVSGKCNEEIDKDEAKKKLDLDKNKNYILITGGSMGAGVLKKMTALLLSEVKDNEHIVVICGSNKKLKKQLDKKFGREKNVHLVGYTNEMYLYMKACDVIFTKPGGLTSTEAAVCRIPIVHTKPIPGCETVNRRFFVKEGMSVSGKSIVGQAKKGLCILRNRKKAEKIKENQKRVISGTSAKDIYEFCKEKVK